MSSFLPVDESGKGNRDVGKDSIQRDRKWNSEIITYTLSKKLRLIVYMPDKTSLYQPLCILLLLPNTVCSFIGKARLVHLTGPPIHILGATLKADPCASHVLFSPNSHALLTFNQFSAEVENSGLLSENDLSVILSSILPSSVANMVSAPVVHELIQMNNCPSVLLLQPFACRVTDSLMNVRKFKDLFSSEVRGSVPDSRIARLLGFGFLEFDDSRGFRVSPQMFRLSSKFKALAENEVNPDVVTSINGEPLCCSTNPVLLIAGPKSAGKSSLLRFIINNFLTHNQVTVENKLSVSSLAVLDCDIGQPEFTPSGMVSLTLISRPLFGPPFTHQLFPDLKPIRQCFVGCTTPSTAPQFYIDCLAYVFQAYNDLPEPRPPLIVNTMGWTQGLGLTLLIEQILTVKPDIIAQIQLNNEQPGVRLNLPILDSNTLQSMQGWHLQASLFLHFETCSLLRVLYSPL
ncbi:hypothetical protein P879_09483 [Paragonimus westermani]|uniref:Clp1 P-loop domain-containing protein n=1 Tax=Paragonimus westermani TaxID=34504 RepID=A0A8T0DG64_9TREM|nr:hypothetical protein P879_09483 [Paragonimus westermani]